MTFDSMFLFSGCVGVNILRRSIRCDSVSTSSVSCQLGRRRRKQRLQRRQRPRVLAAPLQRPCSCRLWFWRTWSRAQSAFAGRLRALGTYAPLTNASHFAKHTSHTHTSRRPPTTFLSVARLWLRWTPHLTRSPAALRRRCLPSPRRTRAPRLGATRGHGWLVETTLSLCALSVRVCLTPL